MEKLNDLEVKNDIDTNQQKYYIKNKQSNFWKIIAIISTTLLFLLLLLYLTNFGGNYTAIFQNKKGTETNSKENAKNNKLNQETNIQVKFKPQSNQLFIEGISFTYPDNWEIVFSNEAFYFSKDKAQTQELLKCVSENSCTNYPLKISGKKISINENVIPTNDLTPTLIDGQTAFLGYANPQEESLHSTIFDSPEIKLSITSESSSPDNSMLKEFVANIPNATVEKYEPAKSSGKLLTNAAFIEISSSLEINNKDILNTILKNTLSPKNLTESYEYLLYTKTLKKYRQEPDYWSPDQPESNLLNNSYALSTNNPSLSFGLYETPQIKINVSSGPTNLNLYLSSNKYCETNLDCFYRSSGCRIGTYNKYGQLSSFGFGCEAPEFEGMDNQIDYYSMLGCSYDGEEVLVKYDNLSCISNSCQVINATPACFKTIK